MVTPSSSPFPGTFFAVLSFRKSVVMNCEAFTSLSPKKQRQVVVDRGVALGKRESRNFFIYLFAVDAFYVEVYFFKESGEYGTLKPFIEMDGLDPYLNDIQLGDLLAVLR